MGERIRRMTAREVERLLKDLSHRALAATQLPWIALAQWRGLTLH